MGRYTSRSIRVRPLRRGVGQETATCAFSTFYGSANLNWFEVWTYQVDSSVVHLGDPIDLTKRLCGTTEIRRSLAPVIMANAA